VPACAQHATQADQPGEIIATFDGSGTAVTVPLKATSRISVPGAARASKTLTHHFQRNSQVLIFERLFESDWQF
jgi:hypothetical protein